LQAWISEETDRENQATYNGTYQYQRTGFNITIEKPVDIPLHNAPYTTTFTFETPTTGKWVQSLSNGFLKFTGTFGTFPT
jgi:hypothetical protein